MKERNIYFDNYQRVNNAIDELGAAQSEILDAFGASSEVYRQTLSAARRLTRLRSVLDGEAFSAGYAMPAEGYAANILFY